MPVWSFDVGFDEWNNSWYYGVLNSSRKEGKAGSCGHGDIPFVFICIFVLTGKQYEQDRDDLGQSNFCEELGLVLWCLTILLRLKRIGYDYPRDMEDTLTHLLRFDRQLDFFLANRGPELDCLKGDPLIRMLHANDG
jgi:hypothetical protein